MVLKPARPSPNDRRIQTSKKIACQRQIVAAMAHLQKMQLECAITLAAAAEGMLPDTEGVHLFAFFKQSEPYKTKQIDFNSTINWLKHDVEANSDQIYEFDAFITVARAMTKYHAAYRDAPNEWLAFLKNYFPDLPDEWD
jgi:hypothetical protein